MAATYNEMAERMTAMLRELQQQEAVRRDLVANVSHDLRTPLASLRGYLETLIIKGASLSAEEQRTYLSIATQQTERLAQLVSELFELAKLESKEVTVQAEAFPVAELIAYLSGFMTLSPGDVLLLGPGEGSPNAHAGDTVVITVNGLGQLRHSLTQDITEGARA